MKRHKFVSFYPLPFAQSIYKLNIKLMNTFELRKPKCLVVYRIILTNALVLLSTVKTEYVKFKENGFKLCLQLSCEHSNLLSF